MPIITVLSIFSFASIFHFKCGPAWLHGLQLWQPSLFHSISVPLGSRGQLQTVLPRLPASAFIFLKKIVVKIFQKVFSIFQERPQKMSKSRSLKWGRRSSTIGCMEKHADNFAPSSPGRSQESFNMLGNHARALRPGRWPGEGRPGQIF